MGSGHRFGGANAVNMLVLAGPKAPRSSGAICAAHSRWLLY